MSRHRNVRGYNYDEGSGEQEPAAELQGPPRTPPQPPVPSRPPPPPLAPFPRPAPLPPAGLSAPRRCPREGGGDGAGVLSGWWEGRSSPLPSPPLPSPPRGLDQAPCEASPRSPLPPRRFPPERRVERTWPRRRRPSGPCPAAGGSRELPPGESAGLARRPSRGRVYLRCLKLPKLTAFQAGGSDLKTRLERLEPALLQSRKAQKAAFPVRLVASPC